jgi:hypothetical protein
MPDRRAFTIAMTALLSAILISGCGLISSFPGMRAPDAPGAVGPGIPDPAPPGGGGGVGGGGAGGGLGGGDIGIGIDLPPPGGNVVIPNDPTLVVVHPGQVGLHDVSPVELRSRIDATGHVIVRVRWWGGIEPCEILDSVDVVRDGTTFTIALRVGSAGGKVACIEIARDTATLVDLGILPAGRYTVRASTGDAPPITVTIPGPGPS